MKPNFLVIKLWLTFQGKMTKLQVYSVTVVEVRCVY